VRAFFIQRIKPGRKIALGSVNCDGEFTSFKDVGIWSAFHFQVRRDMETYLVSSANFDPIFDA
jgi:hypothetical protein